MSVPGLVRTWQFQGNQIVTSKGSVVLDCQALMFALKQSMKGAGVWTDSTGAGVASAGNWVVRSSCDGSGGAGSFGNNDNVDRWVASTNLIWGNAAVNHSWAVLEQSGIPGAVGNFQVCIDLNQTGVQQNATIAVSPSANFLAGTATARPTAADETVIINTAAWGGAAATNNTALHVLKTNDGKSTRIIALRSSSNATGPYTVMFWDFELPVAITAWTNPWAAVALGASAGFPASHVDTVANLGAAFSTFSRTPGGTNFASKWTDEGTQQHALVTDSYGSDVGQVCLGFDDTAPMLGIGLWSATVNARGRNGKLVDIRAGLQPIGAALSSMCGKTYPSTGTLRQWVQFGDYIHPWNRSLPAMGL